jgi:hypothetical protein
VVLRKILVEIFSTDDEDDDGGGFLWAVLEKLSSKVLVVVVVVVFVTGFVFVIPLPLPLPLPFVFSSLFPSLLLGLVLAIG